jgi:hypothetical protein
MNIGSYTTVVYKLGGFLGSVGHSLTDLRSTRLHRFTGKERGDLELKDTWSSKNPKNRLTVFLLRVL